jgi:hypothetical protein
MRGSRHFVESLTDLAQRSERVDYLSFLRARRAGSTSIDGLGHFNDMPSIVERTTSLIAESRNHFELAGITYHGA